MTTSRTDVRLATVMSLALLGVLAAAPSLAAPATRSLVPSTSLVMAEVYGRGGQCAGDLT